MEGIASNDCQPSAGGKGNAVCRSQSHALVHDFSKLSTGNAITTNAWLKRCSDRRAMSLRLELWMIAKRGQHAAAVDNNAPADEVAEKKRQALAAGRALVAAGW